jgi:hypothetical protein
LDEPDELVVLVEGDGVGVDVGVGAVEPPSC